MVSIIDYPQNSPDFFSLSPPPSSPFSLYLHLISQRSTTPLPALFCTATMAAVGYVSADSNPLLQDFVFSPFDVVEARHVKPTIQELLRRLDGDLTEFESGEADVAEAGGASGDDCG